MNSPLIFSNNLFWDSKVENLDFQKHATQIIKRVMMKGSENDILQILHYYGIEKVKKTVTKVRYLDDVTLSFCCTLFDLIKQDFTCYKHKQSIPTHWNY